MRRSLRFFAAAAAMTLLLTSARAALDVSPADGLPDIWVHVQKAAGLAPGADTDGDGQTNAQEAIAGTNPKVSGDVIKIKSLTKSGSDVTIVFPGLRDKRYDVQSSSTPAASGFAALAVPAFRTPTIDGDVSVTVPTGGKNFFRVVVSDIDTDSDGLTDWEERLVGLSLTDSDSNHDGVSDLAWVSGQLALPDTVSIRPVSTFASEDGAPGVFLVSRSQALFNVTIPYVVSGTATPGVDYPALGGTVILGHGEFSKEISVNPVLDGSLESGESVIVTLLPPAPDASDAYALGSPSAAAVIIAETTVASGSGLTARYYDTASTNYVDSLNFGQTGTYAYTRTAAGPPAAGTIVIPYTGSPAPEVGSVVKISFTSGNLNNALYSHANYNVTAVTAVNFTAAITSTSTLPTSGNGNCSFSFQSFPHPAAVTRVDPTVDFTWLYGTPNGVTIAPTNSPDNYSAVWEAYLQPTTAGNYVFQLDADDKARVLLDTGSGLVEILDHGWNTPATVGTFKQSAAIPLVVPATPAQRYKIRVEYVEGTGDARCRLQWNLNGGTFANISQGNQFTHTQAATYAFTRTSATAGRAVITLTGHGLANGDSAAIAFASGNLFTINAADPNGYSGNYLVENATANSFEIAISGTNLPANVGAGASCFLENRPASTTTGVFNRCYPNVSFAGSPGRVGVDQAVTIGNNGIWGSGTPAVSLIQPETFSVRWSGQVQPQFTEEYTFVVSADDGCTLRINGQLQPLSTGVSTNQGGHTYLYDRTAGTALIAYPSSVVRPGSFIVGETVRLDPSSGPLQHAPAVPPTYTYDNTTGIVVVDYTNLTTLSPGSIVAGETVELDPTSGGIAALGNTPYQVLASPAPTATTFAVNIGVLTFATDSGNININDTRNAVITAVHAAGTGTYSYDNATGLMTVNYSTLAGVPQNSFVVGDIVQLDPTSGNASGLANAPYPITAAAATTFTVNLGAGLFATGTGNINIVDPRTGIVPDSLATAFTVSFGPGKYANNGIGSVNIEVVNKSLKDWSSFATERFVRIPMVGGVRYDIQLDYYENTASAVSRLFWYSPSQPRQIIPSSRLYPVAMGASEAPPILTTPTSAVALVDGPFSLPVAGSNGSTISLSGVPPWLSYTNGVLTGTPPAGTAGFYQILVTATGPGGTGTSVINLEVQESEGSVTREYWNGLTGSGIASIPTGTAPSGTGNLSTLEAPTNFGDNFGARIRGYITAPTTGNYYFWIAASSVAELWIANDDEPINLYKRASVSVGSATPRTWNAEARQKSPWMALEAGKRYYFEALHRAGTGDDNLAIGWLKPGETGSAPSEVVPACALSPYEAPAPGTAPGTLYVATMLSQNGAVTNGVGTSTMRLFEDANPPYAIVQFNYSGLTGNITQHHVHSDPYLTQGDQIIFDMDEIATSGGEDLGHQYNADGSGFGSYKWTIPAAVGPWSRAQLLEIIKQGKSYLNLHTAMYMSGEIRGNYTLAQGSRSFTPPPAPPAWTDDSNTNNGAVRFLTQATFGPNPADIAALKAIVPSGGKTRYELWIEDQFTKPSSVTLPEVMRTENASAQGGAFDESLVFNAWWRNSVSGADQLRQRVAFALSEIHVVSAQGPLDNNAPALAYFYDMLANNAFGNFRDLLEATTLTPTMGRYLDMLRNDKPDLGVGRSPNENYAREIKQLFSVGLFDVWPDGSLKLNSKDELIPTYTQREIVGYAHVFTGWDYGYDGEFRTGLGAAVNWQRPMREVPVRHFTGPKRILNNEVLPGLQTLGGQPLDPYAVHGSNLYTDPAYASLPAQELDASHDQLFNHPNVGPFICRQLIQRLVTSHPSRGYLYRVVQKFNDNGAGVRGDMKAVIKAILLDYEARSGVEVAKPVFGKQREPVLRVATTARAFRPNSFSGTYSQVATGTNPRTITVTTTTAHRLATGNNVFLDFTSGSPAPWIGVYSATVTGNNSFTVQAQGMINGTWSQPANSTVVTVTSGGHWLAAGHKCYIDFTSVTAGQTVPVDGIYSVVTSSGETSSTFTISNSVTSTIARSGSMVIPRFNPGSYTSAASGLPAPNERRITMDTNTDHHLNVGDRVFVNFSTGNPLPVDMEVEVESVVDLNTYTFLATATGTNLGTNQGNNGVWQFPLQSQPLARTGNVSSRPSTFAMGNTDGDLEQSPLNSPTVFNFYLPDYKFPGTLAAQGITSPEFQETAETSVIRQANFLERGVYALGNTNGLSSFRSGTNALVMDLGPWMGNAVSTAGTVGNVLGAGPQPTQAWTSDANLPTLIDRFNTLLMGGALPANVKSEIQTFVLNTTNIPYNNTTPSDTNKRDRLRAVLQFILVSPDFTIQR